MSQQAVVTIPEVLRRLLRLVESLSPDEKKELRKQLDAAYEKSTSEKPPPET